eukprot:scaffold111250_cov16-Prasinocladus_malaysianus.AAC.1
MSTHDAPFCAVRAVAFLTLLICADIRAQPLLSCALSQLPDGIDPARMGPAGCWGLYEAPLSIQVAYTVSVAGGAFQRAIPTAKRA